MESTRGSSNDSAERTCYIGGWTLDGRWKIEISKFFCALSVLASLW